MRIWILMGWLLPTLSLGFEVSPLYLEIAANKPNAALTVHNTTAAKLALEVEVLERIIDAGGNEQRKLDEDSFLIFPPQAAVDVGKSQVFRLQWLGDPTLQSSRSYYVMIKQLPVDFINTDKSGIQLLTNMGASVHIIPVGAKNGGEVIEVQQATHQGKPALEVWIKNSGNRLWYTDTPRYTVTEGGKTYTITPSDIQASEQVELLTPGARRKVLLPIKERIENPTVTLDFP